jgi:excisionase family DNA binding protein
MNSKEAIRPKSHIQEDPFLTVPELATLMKTSPKTVYDWRLKGTGPVGTRVGRAVLFRESDVAVWLDAAREVRR